MNQVFLNGVGVYPFASEEEIFDYLEQRKGILVAVNAEKILHATDETRSTINPNIGYCDGIGAIWALKRRGYKNCVKIPGCELWLKIVARYHGDKSFYLVGGKPAVIEKTVAQLRQQWPDINIVAYRDGYLKGDGEREALINDVAAKRPDVVLVAMGSPKQELLMHDMQARHPHAIYQGLGGSFDVYTGNVERAPKWWLDHNLEWAYRFIRQPKRIIHRGIPLLKFVWKLIFNKF